MSAKAKPAHSDYKLRILDQIVDAANRHDVRALSRLLTDDGVYEDVTLKVKGNRETQRRLNEELFRSFPDLSYKLLNVIVGDNQVLAEFVMTGTNQASYGNRPPTGLSIRLPVAFVLRFSGQRIKRWKSYYDSATLLRQLGV
ncbi:MAG: ester cyclase [Acidobacteriota bacterium]